MAERGNGAADQVEEGQGGFERAPALARSALDPVLVSHCFEPLTPTSFLRRSELVYADKVAVIDGERRVTYAELGARCRRLAGGLRELAGGSPVAVLAPNSLMALEAHFGAPWAGSPLVALNTRLRVDDLRTIIDHAGASVLLYHPDHEAAAQELASGPRAVHLVRDELDDIGDGTYAGLLERSRETVIPVANELALLSLNYTSGTTGHPKGVMYHHRGAYLQSLAMAYHTQIDQRSRYLWTLPMFHCNGWCFVWAVTAAGATHICTPRADPDQIWQLIEDHGVTHLCGAPTVLTALLESPLAHPLRQHVQICTGGAPPSPASLARLDDLGIDVTHLYGLTETLGPAVVCEWQSKWDSLPAHERARLRGRQGVGNIVSSTVRVVDADGADVLADGHQVGEVALRGNNVMLGYYRDEAATEAAIPDGWFRTGDLGVLHPDGYLELTDRKKDVIISGGENISSVEVERAIADHPDVLGVAVIAAPHDRWGEVPVAFVEAREGAQVDERELVLFARERLAHFKVPKRVIFGPLPVTPTGKVQKFRLRAELRDRSPIQGA